MRSADFFLGFLPPKQLKRVLFGEKMARSADFFLGFLVFVGVFIRREAPEFFFGVLFWAFFSARSAEFFFGFFFKTLKKTLVEMNPDQPPLP